MKLKSLILRISLWVAGGILSTLLTVIAIYVMILYPGVRKTRLCESDIEWVECYNLNDTLIFSSMTDRDTLVVSKIKIINYSNLCPYDLEDISLTSALMISKDNPASAYIKLHMINDGKLLRTYDDNIGWCYFMIEKELESDTLVHRISVGDFSHYDKKSKRIFKYGNDTIIESHQLEATSYHAEDGYNHYIWSKNLGLLAYSKRDTLYTLEKRINAVQPISPPE